MPQYGMGFNNPYGVPPQQSYPNMNYNMSHPSIQNPSQPSFSYVNGIEGAKAYPMAANQNVLLMDVENPLFYMKTSNAVGQCIIKTFKFEEVTDTSSNNVKYVTQTEFEDFKAKIEELFKGKDN